MDDATYNTIRADIADALRILEHDKPRLAKIAHYINGEHDLPFLPDNATPEFKQIILRSITNWIPVLTGAPIQLMYVDNFRRGDSDSTAPSKDTPEWLAYQRSNMDARQAQVFFEAYNYGHSYLLTTRNRKGKSVIRGLSPKRTVCLYDDPSVDIDPVSAVYVKKFASQDADGEAIHGNLLYWDSVSEYDIRYKMGDDGKPIIVSFTEKPHGMSLCPVTRMAPFVDLEGKISSMVERLMPAQDRLNQTIFDLLIAQSYSSHQIKTVTGMAPPIKMIVNASGELVPAFDDNGEPIIDTVQVNASRAMFAENPDVKFGYIPGGDLAGFISAAEAALRNLSSLAQVPPHFVLGQIANVSAEALEAAETSLTRLVELLKHSFGESLERCFRLVLELEGLPELADDETGEVIWRDLGTSSLAQNADALGKFADSLGIPKQGLWNRVPGVSKTEISEWTKLKEKEDKEAQIYQAAFGMPGVSDNSPRAPPADLKAA